MSTQGFTSRVKIQSKVCSGQLDENLAVYQVTNKFVPSLFRHRFIWDPVKVQLSLMIWEGVRGKIENEFPGEGASNFFSQFPPTHLQINGRPLSVLN